MTRRLIALLGMAWALPLGAQSGGGFDLTWSSVDGGAGRASANGSLVLFISVGQPDTADNTPLIGGTLRLKPGFLAVVNTDRLFANGFD